MLLKVNNPEVLTELDFSEKLLYGHIWVKWAKNDPKIKFMLFFY